MGRGRAVLIALFASLAASGWPAGATEPQAIYRHVSRGPVPVNSFMVETGQEVVLIDAQAQLSEAAIVAKTIQGLGKPLAAIILTQGQPSQYGGLPALLEAYPRALVYATDETAQDMAVDSMGLMVALRRALPDDTADFIPAPSRRLADGDVLTFTDVRFEIIGIGGGEARDMVMVYLPEANRLFAGDLVSNGMTPFMGAGQSGNWLRQLESVRDRFGDRAPMLFPTHGQPGAFAPLIRDQMAHLLLFRRIVTRNLPEGTLSPEGVANIARAHERLYPDYPPTIVLNDWMGTNIRAVSAELRAGG
ncbi:MAG: MBL fold metallo-hydrolase [Alphaproteobacteria bacterium]